MGSAGCHRYGINVGAMTVSARLHVFGSGTLVGHLVLSWRAWSRCRTSCWLTRSSALILEDNTDYTGCSISPSLISRSVSPPSCSITIIARTLAISNILLEGWKFKHLITNEDWVSSSMHVQVLSQVVLLDSSVNSDSSPGWP